MQMAIIANCLERCFQAKDKCILTRTLFRECVNMSICDASPSSLMDSIMSPKMKTTKGEGIGARSLARSTLG
jgi:hypothetical protein